MNGTSPWIVLEGPDFVGKTTLAGELHDAITQADLPIVSTREPGSPYDENCLKLRRELVGSTWCGRSELLLFLCDRVQHEEAVVLPALARGDLVLQDRGMLSTIVYQVIVDQTGEIRDSSVVAELFDIISLLWVDRRVPDLVVLCSADEDELAKRRKVIGARDRMEERFSDKIINTYRQMHAGSMRIPRGLIGSEILHVDLTNEQGLTRAVSLIADWLAERFIDELS